MRVKLNEKDCILTTLAIIGSGIAGRSLLYNLSKTPHKFDQITLFSEDSFTSPCTLNSTAIVSMRGVTSGISPLGDLLFSAFQEFKTHFQNDRPLGVKVITQYSCATEKLDNFKQRFPESKKSKIFLKNECEIFQEEAYLVDPKIYSDWLLSESRKNLGDRLTEVKELVLEVENGETVKLKTHAQKEFSFTKVVFATGSYQRFWKNLVPGSILESSKPAQGSYLEFNNVELEENSFSLTYNGHNLIWNKDSGRLLIGSSTEDVGHLLAPMNELKNIYEAISVAVAFTLPGLDEAVVKVGLREKAKKREPYLFQEKNCIFFGGLYKNGYSLSIGMTKTLSRQFL